MPSAGPHYSGAKNRAFKEAGAKAMVEQRITARKNPLIQQVRKLLTSRRERETAGLFVADGTKLLDEAVRHWQGLDTVILSDGVEAKLPDHVKVIRVPEEIMAYISPMEAPQGALFLCRLPEKRSFMPYKGMLLLDGIQDPGNLGTILRTADALEIPVALLEGCADPFSHKVVRASMGAVFRSCPVQTTWEQAQAALGAAGIPVGVTALSPRAVDLRTARLDQMALVIGSEGEGVSRLVKENCDFTASIPMYGKISSLNASVAAALLMYEVVRQRNYSK